MFTTAEVFAQARAFLNDQPNSGVFSDTILLEYLRAAWDELELGLQEHDVPSFLSTHLHTLAAGTSELHVAQTGPTILPEDFLLPIYIEESDVGKNNWIPMSPVNWIPEYSVNQYPDTIGQWAWIGQFIRFVPCTRDRDLQIRYIAASPEFVIGSVLGATVANAKAFMARKVAAMAAMFITQDTARAQVLQEEAQNSLEKIVTIHVKQSQNRPTRRKPFRASRRSGLWRPRIP